MRGVNDVLSDAQIRTILSEYREKRVVYEEFSATCRDLLVRLLRGLDLRVHSVTCRTKDVDRLAEKLRRAEKSYRRLLDVTDLSGVRVITYFADDVDRIASLIEREFKVRPEASLDRRKALQPDRFGYLSLHYVSELPDGRLQLPEYKPFAGCVCEIQIRSILQHAWAEIEHDLGYKAEQSIPAEVRRRFSRLASHLEMGDAEFMAIRDELGAYAARIPDEISVSPSAVLIDKVSLEAFVREDQLVRQVDEALAAHVSAELRDSPRLNEKLGEELTYVGLQTIADIREALQTRADLVVEQFKRRLEGEQRSWLGRGIGLFHLFEILLVERGGAEGVLEGFRKFDIGDEEDNPTFAASFAELIHDLTGG